MKHSDCAHEPTKAARARCRREHARQIEITPQPFMIVVSGAPRYDDTRPVISLTRYESAGDMLAALAGLGVTTDDESGERVTSERVIKWDRKRR